MSGIRIKTIVNWKCKEIYGTIMIEIMYSNFVFLLNVLERRCLYVYINVGKFTGI